LTNGHEDDPTNAKYASQKCEKACKAHNGLVETELKAGDYNAYRDSFEAERNGEYDDWRRSVLTDIYHHI